MQTQIIFEMELLLVSSNTYLDSRDLSLMGEIRPKLTIQQLCDLSQITESLWACFLIYRLEMLIIAITSVIVVRIKINQYMEILRRMPGQSYIMYVVLLLFPVYCRNLNICCIKYLSKIK